MEGVGGFFGEFMRQTLVQLACMRYEVACLKGGTEAEALERSVGFMERDFDLMRGLLESQQMDWQAFEQEIQEAVRHISETPDHPSGP